jgi:hypothetical protein
MPSSRAMIVALAAALFILFSCGEAPSQPDEGPRPAGNITEYRGGHIFDGERFVEGRLCVAGGAFVACGEPVVEVVNLDSGFVIPPFGDAHTHHFDGPYTLGWHRSVYLNAGFFYAMTLTAPTSDVLSIRDQLSRPKNVDVATSLGGITGPKSHPAEIYEAVALGIMSFEEQVARAAEIRASRKRADDAYYVVSTPEDVETKLALLLSHEPDLVKVFLRNSQRFDEGFGKWGPGGGIDPDLLPQIRRITEEAGLRLVVANSSIGDFRTSLEARADLVSHLPCYQDSMSDPDNPYFHVDTAEECLISEQEAQRAAAIGMASVLVVTEWAKDRPEPYVDWERQNVASLEAAGAPLAIGSNAYGSTAIDGLIAGVEKGFFEPARLLRLATTETTSVIFPKRRVGCLESGCEASFLVLDGNPLDDFARIRSIRLRVKDGTTLTLEEIEGSGES